MPKIVAVPTSVPVGVLATLSMDAVFVLAALAGGDRFASDKAGLEPVGRWAGGMARGRIRYDDITQEPALRGEALIGLAVHYFTGVALAAAYLRLTRGRGRGPGVLNGAVFGAATALLPELVMYPCWGLGPFALRSDETLRLARLMLLGHTTFGAALGLWSAALAGRTAGRAGS